MFHFSAMNISVGELAGPFGFVRDKAESFWLFLQAMAETDEGRVILGVGAGLLFLLVVLYLVRRSRRGPRDKSLARETRATRLAGYAIALVFFGGFGAWSATATLSGATIAAGVISPEGSRKTVQHLEGGIIQAIHVSEGNSVKQGDPLVTLQNTRALARYEELRERRSFLMALEARLVAEQSAADAVVFPEELQTADDPTAKSAIDSQSALFESRRDVQAAREDILARRVAQLEEEISGLREVIMAQDQQLSLIGEEIDALQALFDRGLTEVSRLLALKREQANIQGQRATNRAAIARNNQQIGETELQLIATRQQRLEEASTQLAETRGELAAINSQLPERIDTLARTQIYAPISGRVLNVQVTTEAGGVIAPGAPILDIVPDGAVLIVDARVKPKDIDTVFPGMRARVVLTAFNQRYLPQVHGEVISVSADRLVDDNTGEPYFLAKVTVDPEELKTLGPNIELVAGMPAEVMILTGERTLFDLMVQPISDSIRRSFRDQS